MAVKIKLSGCELIHIIDRYVNGKETAKAIGKSYNIHKDTAIRILKLCNVKLRHPGTANASQPTKICKGCSQTLNKEDNFGKDRGYYLARCFKCYDKHKVVLAIAAKNRRESNIEESRAKGREYQKKRKEKGLVSKVNPEKNRAYRKKYNQQEACKEKRRKYLAKRAKEMTPPQRLCESVRKNVYNSLRSKKNNRTFDLLGYPKDLLISHIESLFVDGMSWDNYGVNGWHLDHIRPMASFDIDNREEFIKAWSLDNLRPLWASENCSKGSLYNGIRHFYNK